MIDQRLVSAALEKVDTSNFERFAQTFYGAIQDREFVPLGGIHDGGAEGYDATIVSEPGVYVDEANTSFLQVVSEFMQVSKQVTTRKKIRDTVKRLREYGRTPRVLTYITSQTIADIDKEEALLSNELELKIAIRDAKYIEIYINSNQATIGAFHSFLEPAIEYLYRPGESTVAAKSAEQGVDRTLAVFMRQEVESRQPNSGLVASIADSLIIWTLRDTDPDPNRGKLLARTEILQRIEEALPAAKSLVRGVFDHRLSRLVAKDAPGGRQIRHYRKEDKFCLPYETRAVVAVENADDDLLKLRVSCIFEDRISTSMPGVPDGLRKSIVDVCHSSLERVFEHQGLKLAQFIHNAEQDDELYTNVAVLATEVISALPASQSDRDEIRRYTLHVLRGTFYKSTEVERVYLGKLSRTYVLMLLLRNDASVVEHFSKMAGSFHLYIGSDIIIRALSEIYLDQTSQTTINLLRILKSSGSTLILTEKTVEEVATHIRAQILEYENAYSLTDRFIKADAVEYIDRLLIRAYFYARLVPIKGIKPPANWQNYVSQFCDFSDVRSNKGYDELARYLISKFEFSYESTSEMLRGIDQSEANHLAEDIKTAKERGGHSKDSGEILAYNDAVQVLRIYQRRRDRGEASPSSPFGFQTWWLTQDQKVRRGSARTIAAHGGKFFMLRPEFLLTYISLSPSQAEVRNSFRTIFPSALGVRLSSGIRSKVFAKVMRDATEMSKVDEARAGAIVAALTERLKADRIRRFDTRW